MKDKRYNAFESFISNILKTHDGNDRLRALASSESLRDSVDKFLFESQLEAFFIPHEPPQETEYEEVVTKLEKLKNTISLKYTRTSDPYEYDIVNLILTKYSEKNCLLSKEILLYLNDLYKKYK
jgi:hypothetical protein